MTGHDILAALFEVTDPLARDHLLVEATQLGLYDPLTYVPIESAHGAHRATFMVASQPLKFGGVRVTVSARTQQRIADVLGCTLPTPKLLRLMHEQAAIRVAPYTRSVQGMASPEAMVEASQMIDDRVKRAIAVGAPPDGLLSMCAKSWTISRAALSWQGRVPNMGLANNPPQGAPVTWMQTPQSNPENAHNFDHLDYSQLCWLVLGSCVVDGVAMQLQDVALNPALCPLLSDDSLLHAFRINVTPASSFPTPLDELPAVDWEAIEAHRVIPMHYRPDLVRRPDLVVIHCTQGAEAANGAENTMSWFRTGPFPHGPASVHWTVDSDSTVAGPPEDRVAYGARGANHDGIHIEICGRVEQGHAGWSDAFSQAAITRAALVTARALQTWEIPLRWVPASELKASYHGVRGITSHASVTRGRKESTHTDPGISFPVLRFLRLVERAMCPA